MSHPFGDLLRQYRARKASLSQTRLAELAGYDKAILSRMSRGMKDLIGPSGRERVVRLISVLRDEGVLTALDEANALLAAAHLSPLYANQPDEAALIQKLRLNHRPASAHTAQDTRPIQHNLPAQLTRFIGREREVTEILQLVGAHRLITLTGSGGVGKTRLAIEVGTLLPGVKHAPLQHDRAEAESSGVSPPPFMDGVWLAELAPLADPALVSRVVAEMFNLPDAPGRTSAQMLVEYLKGKFLLLVLDNCEHLVGACAELVESLLRACPHLHVLATSREALRIPGEVTWRVPPLDTPDPAHLPPLERVADYAAVELFIDHAARAQPDFTLTPANLTTIAQICRRLDGIPLALEMAAAQLAILSVETIATGLDDRFALLTRGSRTALPRHQTLRATLDWSYGLLSQAERVLLARLSVFAGGWTAELAEVVAADEDGTQSEQRETKQAGGVLPALGASNILPLLLQLAEKSLVVAESRGGAMRYRMLETVRQYAAETLRVIALGGMDARYERLADYVVSRLTPDDGPSRRTDSEVAVARMGRLEAELDNLRALVSWAQTRADGGATSLRLTAALADYWGTSQGHMAEVQAWLEEALARGHAAPGPLRQKAMNGLLRTGGTRGYNMARWEDLAEESLALSADTGMDDPYERVESLYYANFVQLELWMKRVLWAEPTSWDASPHLSRMEALLGEMLAVAQQVQYSHGIILGHMWLGEVHFLWGDHAAAQSNYESGLRLAQETGNLSMFLTAINLMARIDPPRALAECEHEVARQRALGKSESLAQALRQLGLFSASKGEYAHAQSLLMECIAVRNELGVPWGQEGGIGHLHYDLGRIAWLQDDYTEALDQLQNAFDIVQKAGLLITVSHIHLYAGLAHLALGDVTRASGRLRQALNLYRELDAVEFVHYALTALGMLAQAQAQPARAGRLVGAAEMLRERARKWPWFWAVDRWYWVMNRRVHERLVKAVSGVRDDLATAGAWVEGQQMSPDRAVEYALQKGEADEPSIR